MNVPELLPVELGLRSLLVDSQGQHIRVVSDNKIAVSYINGMGGGGNLCLVTASLVTFGPGLLIGEIASLRRIHLGHRTSLQTTCHATLKRTLNAR